MDAPRISAQDAHRLYEEGRAVFVDARNPNAWGARTDQLPGAVRLTPHDSSDSLMTLPRDRTVIAYCT